MTERWKRIRGFPNYEVSDLGRVRNRRKGNILKPSFQGPYFVVGLYRRLNGKLHQKVMALHKIVLTTFVGPRPKGKNARHFPDRDPTNNKLSNLSWATQLVNQRDRFVHGTHSRGEQNGSAKLSVEDIAFIREIANDPEMIGTEFRRMRGGPPTPYGRNSRIAKKIKTERGKAVTPTMIGYILRGENWA